MKNRISHLKTAFPLLFSCLSLPGLLSAQTNVFPGCSIVATGTGRTTGEVLKLSIHNPTNTGVTDKLGPFLVSSGGDYQPYIVPQIQQVTVPPMGSVDVMLNGFCTDIRKSPPGTTDILPPVSGWITIREPAIRPFSVTELEVHPDNYSESAPYLLSAIRSIGDAYDKLRSEGKISTPRSGNPEKEREEVIQQTFWIYTAALRKDPYKQEDFRDRTYSQFEKAMSASPQTLPADKKEQLDKGIADFWNTFEAVGAEAKVLSKTGTTPDNKEPSVTIAPVKTCGCDTAHLIESQPLKVYPAGDRYNAFRDDTIPMRLNQVFIEEPWFLCICKPEDCLPEKVLEKRVTITYKDKRYASPPSQWVKHDINRRNHTMERQGEMLIEYRFRCSCREQPCLDKLVTKKLVFAESNKCCDKIREKNNGDLKFNLKNGWVQIRDNTVSFQVPGCAIPPLTFDFSLEYLFCNLAEDQVFAQLLQLMKSERSGGKISEFYSSSDLRMGGPSTDKSMSRYYAFGFSKRVNEKEYSVFFSVDESRCATDISLLCDGKLLEHAAPPYISPEELTLMANVLGDPQQGQTWSNAMLILSHLARANDYNKTGTYLQTLNSYLAKLLNLISALTSTQAGDKMLQQQLAELKAAVTESLTRTGFNGLHKIMEKMIPVSNAMNK